MHAARDFRIAVADDHPIIRHAVVSALGSLPGCTVAAAARSGQELLHVLSEGIWGLVVTDFSMDSGQNDADGFALILRLRKLHPHVPILVFTMSTSDDVLYRLSQSGVAGIVDKSAGIEEFQRVAREIMLDHRPSYSEKILGYLQSQTERRTRTLEEGLTKKELEVVRQFAAGTSLTDIANLQHRSISTVATQKANAMKKLNLRTNAELVKYAQENGLV
jgi:two-component system capsular synthesis response regulator RcsB